MPPPDRPPLQRGGLSIDFARHLITVEGAPLDLSLTEFALLVYLADAAPRVVPAIELAREVQGYTSEKIDDANETLRYHIYRLRRKIKEATGQTEFIQTVRGIGYALNMHASIKQPSGLITFLFSDIEGSTQLWEQHSHTMKSALTRHDAILRQIVEKHGGYVFKTMGDEFCVAFAKAPEALAAALATQRALRAEQWDETTRLRVRIALHTGTAEEREGDYLGSALNLVARLLSAGHGGQILLSPTTHAEIVKQLPPDIELRDLGIRRFKGLRELHAVFQIVAPDLPYSFPPLRTLDPRPNNLPGELASFIGREAEVRAFGEQLRRPTVRLLTLTGPGGIGKTRLGLRVAASVLDEYEDGVFLVPLAAVRDPALVAPAIAQLLNVPEDHQHPVIETLVKHLRSRQILLLLDNFEQILEAAPLLNDLLRGAPQLKLLVTSREALQIYGEHVYGVEPLPLLDKRERPTLALLEQCAATTLFIQRAQASTADWVATEKDAPTIAAVCMMLDGLPLAIELAAARLAQFPLSDLAAQLTHRLSFLNTGPRDLPARQRTLHGMLDWSYDLLPPPEQTLFARLAVFVGGWTTEAAQQVMAGLPAAPTDIAAALQSLARKSLLQLHTDSAPRYTMLETLREYAWERLSASGELAAIRHSHATYYQRVVEAAEADLLVLQQQTTLKILEAEHDNLRAALAWVLAGEKRDLALQVGGVLWRFWAMRSHLREGRQWLEQALGHYPEAPASLRAKALWGLGRLALFQADYAVAQKALEDSLALYREIADPKGIAWTLNSLGEIASMRGDYIRARTRLEESLTIHRAVDEKLGIAKCLGDLGSIAFAQADIVQAAQLLSESLRLRRELGSVEGIAVASINLSEALRVQGDYQRAEACIQESLQLYQYLNHPSGISACWDALGELRSQQNDFEQAVACYVESLTQLCELEQEEKPQVAKGLIALAGALHHAGRDYAATQVLGAAEAWREAVELSPHYYEAYDQRYAATRAQLGKSAWARAWSEGQAMSLWEVVTMLRPA